MNNMSVCFKTEKVDECREFYQKYFNGRITFDCGWYVSVALFESDYILNFMQPQGGEALFNGNGITINISVENVDVQHERLDSLGLKSVEPLADHPWGDRGFSVNDPMGNSIYLYTDIEPTDEFKQYFK